MAKCDICGKGVKAIVDGTPRHVYVCTRCLRSNKVERAI